MRNIKITLAYDGTDFCGWQIQPGQPTIQGVLTEMIEKLTQSRPTLYGAGRTDAGVHAAGQVANFKTGSTLTVGEFQRALNALLPPTIRVVASEEVLPDFHARWNAVAKTYRYRVFRDLVVPPFLYKYVQHEPYPLDFAAMVEAARMFEGENDFASFAASAGSDGEDRERTTTRLIYHSEIMRAGEGNYLSEREEWVYVVRGKSFLRYMVRNIVGTLMDVGRGKLAPDDIPKLFALRDRSKCGPTMPPQGLCMMQVEYGEPTLRDLRKDLQSATTF